MAYSALILCGFLSPAGGNLLVIYRGLIAQQQEMEEADEYMRATEIPADGSFLRHMGPVCIPATYLLVEI